MSHLIANSCVSCRKTLGTSRHLKTDEKGLAYTELHLVEQGGCSGPGMTTDVARDGKSLAYLSSPVSTLDTFEAVFSFDFREVFLTI